MSFEFDTTRRPLRIAILGVKTFPATAGADRVVEQLLGHLPRTNRYTLYLIKDQRQAIDLPTHIEAIYISSLKGKHLRPFSFFLLSAMHVVLRGQHDIAHLHNSDVGLVAPLLKLKPNMKLVGTFHGDPYLREKWGALAKLVLRGSEWSFVLSCDALTSVSPFKKARGRLVHHIPNGITHEIGFPLTKSLAVQHSSLIAHEYVMFACGRLDRTKGAHHLIEAFSKMVTDKKLLILGDFSQDLGYSRFIEYLARNDPRVVLHRTLIPRDSLLSTIRQSAAFVLPSEVEAMSMILLEAISCGQPVVCSDIRENVAVVGDDYPLLHASANAEDLRRVLEKALTMTIDERRKLTTRYQKLAERYSWSRIGNIYAKLYATLVER